MTHIESAVAYPRHFGLAQDVARFIRVISVLLQLAAWFVVVGFVEIGNAVAQRRPRPAPP